MATGARSQPLRERNRQLAQDLVLDAAKRLLQRSPSAEFSMRALAAEAGVGFATPFNHFGNKNAIMQALSARLIESMSLRFEQETPGGDAVDRVLAMGKISVATLLEQPDVSKAVVGSLGVVNPSHSVVRPNSEGLWLRALGDFSGLDLASRDLGRALLPQQLAFTFRGCVSFWIAGELSNDMFSQAFQAGALTVLLGFVDPAHRGVVLTRINPVPAPSPMLPRPPSGAGA